jgi:hypothetical protein
MNEMTYEEMVEVEGGGKLACAVAWIGYGGSLLSFGVATGGLGLALAGITYGTSIVGVVSSCT